MLRRFVHDGFGTASSWQWRCRDAKQRSSYPSKAWTLCVRSRGYGIPQLDTCFLLFQLWYAIARTVHMYTYHIIYDIHINVNVYIIYYC